MNESMYTDLLKRVPLPKDAAFSAGVTLAIQCHQAGGLEDGWTVVPGSAGKRLRSFKPRGRLTPALPGWKWAWGELAKMSAAQSD